jgi:hypothetical protein
MEVSWILMEKRGQRCETDVNLMREFISRKLTPNVPAFAKSILA